MCFSDVRYPVLGSMIAADLTVSNFVNPDRGNSKICFASCGTDDEVYKGDCQSNTPSLFVIHVPVNEENGINLRVIPRVGTTT